MTEPVVVTHPRPDLAWLARWSEDIVDPDLPIVDPHHHFWDRPGYSYMLDDFLADLDTGHNVVATLYVQASWAYRNDGPENMRPVGETEFIAALAAEADRRTTRTRVCAGVVAYADLMQGDRVEPVIAAHLAASGRVRGIRNITSYDSQIASIKSTQGPASRLEERFAGMMGTDAFRAGFACLKQFNLAFDACLYHPQLGELVDLAREFPETPIVLDHTGGPLGIGRFRDRGQEVFADWRQNIRALAACQNVHMKLGGLGMVLSGFDFHARETPPSSDELAAAWGPYFLEAIEAFGPERCMFEGNFPPDKSVCSYVTIWNAFKKIASGATADQKRALFHGTATRFYGLHLPGSS